MAERFEIALDVSGTAGAVAADRAVGQLTERISSASHQSRIAGRDIRLLASVMAGELSPAAGQAASALQLTTMAMSGLSGPIGGIIAVGAAIASITAAVIVATQEQKKWNAALVAAARARDLEARLAPLRAAGRDLDERVKVLSAERALAEAVGASTARQVDFLRQDLALRKERLHLEVETAARTVEAKHGEFTGAGFAIRNAEARRRQDLESSAAPEIEKMLKRQREESRDARALDLEDITNQIETQRMRQDAHRAHALQMVDIEEQLTGDLDAARRRRAQLEDEGSAAEIRALHQSTQARMAALNTRAEGASVEELRRIFFERTKIIEDAATREEQIAQQAAENRARRAADEKRAREQARNDARGVGEGLLSEAAGILRGRGINQFDLGDLQAVLKEQQDRAQATRRDLLTGGAVSGDELTSMLDAGRRGRAADSVGGNLADLLQRGAGGESVSDAWGRAAEASHAAWGESFNSILADTDTFVGKFKEKISAASADIRQEILGQVDGIMARKIELEDRRF